MTRMHADEVPADVELVRRLLAGQFPQWAQLRVVPVASWGTDHHIFRLGEHLAVRLPRIGWAQGQAEKEARWLPVLAPRLPLSVPAPAALGAPAHGYPFTWSVQQWLPGDSASAGGLDDHERAAVDLARFVQALRAVDTAGAPARATGSRGCPLAELDEAVRGAVTALGDRVDALAVLRSWQEALDAPAHPGPGVWLHGDLLPGNLLVVAGRLSAVIDFGGLGVGDPACDLLAAWNAFPAPLPGGTATSSVPTTTPGCAGGAGRWRRR